MAWTRTVALCLLLIELSDLSSGLMLERLPRHIPRSKDHAFKDSVDEESFGDSVDDSVAKTRLREPSQVAPTRKTWRATLFPAYDLFADNGERMQRKRNVPEDSPEDMDDEDRHELANILRDDEEGDEGTKEGKRTPKETTHAKTKRQSKEEVTEEKETKEEESANETAATKDFQDWLRREYYRNMAKSFASMRRKRDSSYAKFRTTKRDKKSHQSSGFSEIPQSSGFSEITDNLRNIEDQLFEDALQAMRGSGGDDFDGQRRISNDLNLAYDLETMRNAFFRLRETLANMQEDSEPEEVYSSNRKRSHECPALDQLTSDCTALSDIMQDGSMKRLLRRACNWHEVCYTCGKVYGLTSEECDGGFVEQTQTICRGDAPCESTASLLMVPLRQRRVFYKRSNPDVCLDEPCVEAFLKEGLSALQEGRYNHV